MTRIRQQAENLLRTLAESTYKVHRGRTIQDREQASGQKVLGAQGYRGESSSQEQGDSVRPLRASMQ